MTTGCRIQLYGHQDLNPIIKPTLKTVPMNCHSAIVYPFSNHIKNGIKKTLICLQAVIMLSEKTSPTLPATRELASSFARVISIKSRQQSVTFRSRDFLVSTLFPIFWGFGKFGLSFSFRQFCLGFGIFLKTKVSVSFLKSLVSEMFPYWSWKKSVQFTGSIRRVVCDDFPNKRTI